MRRSPQPSRIHIPTTIFLGLAILRGQAFPNLVVAVNGIGHSGEYPKLYPIRFSWSSDSTDLQDAQWSDSSSGWTDRKFVLTQKK